MPVTTPIRCSFPRPFSQDQTASEGETRAEENQPSRASSRLDFDSRFKSSRRKFATRRPSRAMERRRRGNGGKTEVGNRYRPHERSREREKERDSARGWGKRTRSPVRKKTIHEDSRRAILAYRRICKVRRRKRGWLGRWLSLKKNTDRIGGSEKRRARGGWKGGAERRRGLERKTRRTRETEIYERREGRSRRSR